MFKGLFEARTLTLLILILSVVNALTAILSGHTDIMWGWISATAGWYTVWDLTKNK
jgi:cystathionine beta-lyase/cystathionine gamma-synthase